MKKNILNILAFLLGIMMLNGGLNKIFNYIPTPDNLPEELMKDNAALMEISWLMPLIAYAEIIGGLLLFFPKTRALGILVLFPVMVGILLTHIFVAPSGLVMALVLWAVFIWLIYENKAKYLVLFK